jgi:hypothetical protein
VVAGVEDPVTTGLHLVMTLRDLQPGYFVWEGSHDPEVMPPFDRLVGIDKVL